MAAGSSPTQMSSADSQPQAAQPSTPQQNPWQTNYEQQALQYRNLHQNGSLLDWVKFYAGKN